MQSSECSPAETEEQIMTFQIAMVGCDGLVIGSDQLGRYGSVINGKQQLPQIVFQPKYLMSENRSFVCFASGGPMAVNLAWQIISECDPYSKLKGVSEPVWEQALRQTAMTLPLTYRSPIDELLISRADTPYAFWRIVRMLMNDNNTFTAVQKMQQVFCTGTNTVAQFLPRHLWNKNRSVHELTRLALLTLSYAAGEEPSSVGPPFDIVSLNRDGFSCSLHNDPIEQPFQRELERTFLDSLGDIAT